MEGKDTLETFKILPGHQLLKFSLGLMEELFATTLGTSEVGNEIPCL